MESESDLTYGKWKLSYTWEVKAIFHIWEVKELLHMGSKRKLTYGKWKKSYTWEVKAILHIWEVKEILHIWEVKEILHMGRDLACMGKKSYIWEVGRWYRPVVSFTITWDKLGQDWINLALIDRNGLSPQPGLTKWWIYSYIYPYIYFLTTDTYFSIRDIDLNHNVQSCHSHAYSDGPLQDGGVREC